MSQEQLLTRVCNMQHFWEDLKAVLTLQLMQEWAHTIPMQAQAAVARVCSQYVTSGDHAEVNHSRPAALSTLSSDYSRFLVRFFDTQCALMGRDLSGINNLESGRASSWLSSL